MRSNLRARFFKYIQDVFWYQLFLEEIIQELKFPDNHSRILDVGTGPGKLLEHLVKQTELDCVGVDCDPAMLTEAKKRLNLTSVPFVQTGRDDKLPFQTSSFDAVCFCSILFLLDDPSLLLKEALRVLKPGGKILILSPSGFKRRDFFQPLLHNQWAWSFWLWRILTRSKSRKWFSANFLESYCITKRLIYSRRTVFNNYAVLELLESRH